MIYDSVATFFFYLIGILVFFTIAAAAADLLEWWQREIHEPFDWEKHAAIHGEDSQARRERGD